MELTWPIKLRIAAAAAVGIALIGIYCWPRVAPAEPFGVVSVVNGRISVGDAMVILGLAFVAGLVSYFLAWPYGSRIGILAVPAGLAVWAVRCGDMGTLMQLNTSIVRREQLFSTFCWEPMLWLGVVAAGFLGVFLGSQIIRPRQADEADKSATKPRQTKGGQAADKPDKRNAGALVNAVVAVIGSAVVTQFFIGIFARDFSIWNATTGSAIAQPATGQIVFAVLVSFGLAGFLVKKVLNVDYLWPIIASCMVNLIAISTYGKNDTIAYFAGRWPAVFFSNSVLAVLPIQVVAFGTLGAIAGYWLAVRYDYWRQHEAEDE
jgi:hypothetical protein